MSATKLLCETDHNPGWKLTVDGVERDGHWRAESPHGSVESVVVCDSEGNPVFDRPVYREAENVNLVVYGYTLGGEVKIAIIRQPRPHADEPGKVGQDGHDPVVFGQVPMGFVEKVFGEDIEAAATRETEEETGARVVISIQKPAVPWHNPNPTFVSTWSDLLFVEVDLGQVEQLRSTRNEPIFSAEFVSPAELIKRIAEGDDETGAVYRMCTANSILLIFFATFPDLWPR